MPIVETLRRHSRPLRPEPTGWEPVLVRLPRVRAVLFDIYGTLFVSGAGALEAVDGAEAADALSEALEIVGLRTRVPPAVGVERLHQVIRAGHEAARRQGNDHPEVDIVQAWHDALAGLMTEGAIEPARLGRGLLRRLAVEFECRTNPVWPMPHAAWCLETLRERGIVLGLISNAQFFTRRLFPALLGASAEGLGFARSLQYYSYRRGRAKPGLALHQAARAELARRGIPPEETLCVGNDMRSDVLTAATLGFKAALFAGDRRSLRVEAAGTVPDLVLTDLAQLPPCLVGGRRAGRNSASQGRAAWGLYGGKLTLYG